MPADDAYIIRIFDAAVTPEDTAARAAEVVTLLAQGVIQKLVREAHRDLPPGPYPELAGRSRA